MDYDVIIVGAGPAGLSTGLHLAECAPKLAARTLMLDRARHPRPKLCAGGIMPGGEAWLQGLGLDLGQVPAVDVCEAHFAFEGREMFVVRREPYVFRIVRRDQFDAWLAEAARERGLSIQEERRVREVRASQGADGGLMEVVTDGETYRCRAVVGADGANSVVRRAMVGQHQYQHQLSRLLEALIPADAYPFGAEINGHRRKRATIDFSWMNSGVQGYVWDFPTQVEGRPMHTRGIFDSRIHGGRPRADIKAALRAWVDSAGVEVGQYKLRGHPMRWFRPRGPFSAPGVLLVGDAAGVDPLLGEGISFALGYGQVAAEELRRSFASGDLSFRGYRGRVLRHRIGRYLGRRHAVAWVIYGLRARWLLRFLSWNMGSVIGWLAERFWVDWGE